MKKLTLAAVALMTPLLFLSCKIEKPAEPERKISVSGTGTVFVDSDIINLTFDFSTEDRDIDNAKSSNAKKIENFKTALIKFGISENDITKSSDSISFRKITAITTNYTVNNKILVTVRNPENAAEIVKLAVQNESVALSSYKHSVSDTTEAIRSARTLAVQNAYETANLIAGATGSSVGNVMQISEYYVNTADRNYSEIDDGRDEKGRFSVTATVTIEYLLN